MAIFLFRMARERRSRCGQATFLRGLVSGPEGPITLPFRLAGEISNSLIIIVLEKIIGNQPLETYTKMFDRLLAAKH